MFKFIQWLTLSGWLLFLLGRRLNFFSCWYDKNTLKETTEGRKGSFSFVVCDGREVKALAASHMIPTVRGRQQSMQARCCQACFPHSHIVQNLLPIKHRRIADLSTSTSVIQRIFHRHAQWAISWMALDFVKVIINSDHHGTFLLFWIFPNFLDWRYWIE